MQYRTMLEYETIDKLKPDLKSLHPGLWMLDLDPKCEKVLLGPFNTVAEAHDNRDYIWHYGDRFGRYLWLVGSAAADTLATRCDSIQHIEVAIDTLPLEVIGMRIKVENVDEWIRAPKRKTIK